jgi:HK97 family phage major capsid protein
MNLSDLNDKLNQLGNSWDHFKKVNDERLRQLENKGFSDPLTEESLSKINGSIDEQKAKIEKIETALARPASETKEFKFIDADELEYKKAFDQYIRRGADDKLANLETKNVLNTSIIGDSYGGFLATPNMQRIIAGEIKETCIMRKICSVQEISTSALDIIDDDSFATSWNSEEGTVNDSNTSILTKKSIPTFDLVAQPRVTQKLIDDSAINMEDWLAHRLAQEFALAEENAFINGVGFESNQPRGILNYQSGISSSAIQRIKSESATDGSFNEDELLLLYYSISEKYINRASFLMSRSATQSIRKLKDTTSGQYLWNPALLGGQEDTLLGCPVYQSAYMPAVGGNTLSIILGDFSQYQIVDRTGIRLLRDPYTSKPYVRFYTTKRVGGDVIRTEAFKVLECGANQ